MGRMDLNRMIELCAAIRRAALELEDAAVLNNRGSGEVSAALIRSILRARRHRGVYFDERLFADPAWDMMLDLLAARLECRPVSVSSLCVASGVPQTTALRWIGVLVDRDIIVRRQDPADGRRVLVGLSDGAAMRLQCCLSEVEAATSCGSTV